MSNSPELGNLLWQFELHGVPLFPRLVTRGEMEGLEGEFWLKVWGERLLFCAASTPDRVFAVTTDFRQTSDLVSHWRVALETGKFGRLVMHPQSLTGAEEMDSAFLIIHEGDGTRWIREWCAGQWMKVRPTRPLTRPIWHAQWKPPRSLAVPEETLKGLLSHPFPEDERKSLPFVWLRGSRRELQQVVEACITLKLSSPRLRDIQGEWHKEAGDRFYYFAHTPFFKSWMYGHGRQSWHISEPWATLVKRNFVGVGWNWTRRKNKDESLREGWKVAPSIQTTAIRVLPSPSQHERLEAMLFLRDWLRGKLPDSQIEEMLHHVRI